MLRFSRTGGGSNGVTLKGDRFESLKDFSSLILMQVFVFFFYCLLVGQVCEKHVSR